MHHGDHLHAGICKRLMVTLMCHISGVTFGLLRWLSGGHMHGDVHGSLQESLLQEDILTFQTTQIVSGIQLVVCRFQVLAYQRFWV